MNKPKSLYQLGTLIPACEVYIIHKDSVLMHQRAKDKKKFPGYWIGPGGHIDEGEDALSAAIREVKEETGVHLKENAVKLKVVAFHHHIDRDEVWVEYLFCASISARTKITQTPEGISKWIPITKLKNVFPPSAYYFDHILGDKPGILFNSSQWKGAKLFKLLAQRMDKDN